MKQYEAVIQTLEQLGGIATLGQLYTETFKIKNCVWNTKTPFASIRRIVQTTDDIYKIKPGLYALKKYKKEFESKGVVVQTAKNQSSNEVIAFNHSYYQGLIVTIGNLNKLNTYVPPQDRNKSFLEEKLNDIITLTVLPSFTYPNLVKRSSTVDVIWFNERGMPSSFFEIEFSTDIQNSLLKFNDLQDFNTDMFIVADNIREREYTKKINNPAFKDIGNRVQFFGYDELLKYYENTIQRTSFSVKIRY